MVKSNILVGLVCLAVSSLAVGHSLSPTRLYAPSGSERIGYTMRASNQYDVPATFSVECYRNALGFVQPCFVIPKAFTLRPNQTRNFRFRIDTQGRNGLYLICTVYDPQKSPGGENIKSALKTRICAKFGVGVDPETGEPK